MLGLLTHKFVYEYLRDPVIRDSLTELCVSQLVIIVKLRSMF
jgi:hypothetical protein